MTSQYDGTENAALAAHARIMIPARAETLFSDLVSANMQRLPGACLDLLTRLLRKQGAKPKADWIAAFQKMAAVIVQRLPRAEIVSEKDLNYLSCERANKAKPLDAKFVAALLDALAALEAGALRETAATNIVAGPAVFDPGTVIVPALGLLRQRHGSGIESDAAFLLLWAHAADFLLTRSEHPPEPPKDWRQEVTLSCKCEDCRALQTFAGDPEAQVSRFRVRKDRRQHMHQVIERHRLDMTHVTERKSSPQTLVCTKTRQTYQRQCEQYRADLCSFGKLIETLPRPLGARASLTSRMADACVRQAD